VGIYSKNFGDDNNLDTPFASVQFFLRVRHLQ